jgi:hypothetical protein
VVLATSACQPTAVLKPTPMSAESAK